MGIFNADETGLFYKMHPIRTVHFVGAACNGGELSEERLTVLLCANRDGSENETALRFSVSGKGLDEHKHLH